MMPVAIDLICPECGNNACLLVPEVFAIKHLPYEGNELYWEIRNKIDQYAQQRQLAYIQKLAEAACKR